MGLLFLVAGILSVLAFPFNPLIIFRVFEPNDIRVLRYVGWMVWIVGMTLVFLPYYYLYSRRVKGLIDSGIYAIVRHPLHPGWILSIFITTIFLHQHWLFVIIGIPGIASIYLISKLEEHDSVEKFGDDYIRYMEKMPSVNLLLGTIRLATGITYFGMGITLGLRRFLVVGVIGGALSASILLTSVSFSIAWLLFGAIWFTVLSLSGFWGLRQVLSMAKYSRHE